MVKLSPARWVRVNIVIGSSTHAATLGNSSIFELSLSRYVFSVRRFYRPNQKRAWLANTHLGVLRWKKNYCAFGRARMRLFERAASVPFNKGNFVITARDYLSLPARGE